MTILGRRGLEVDGARRDDPEKEDPEAVRPGVPLLVPRPEPPPTVLSPGTTLGTLARPLEDLTPLGRDTVGCELLTELVVGYLLVCGRGLASFLLPFE